MVAKGLLVDKCRVMSSKKLPLWLTFVAADGLRETEEEQAVPGAEVEAKAAASGAGDTKKVAAKPQKTISVLFKEGDDLRQDQLTLQVLKVMDKLWKKEGLNLNMNAYGCVSTGDEIGMLEIVLDSATLAGILQESLGEGSGIFHKLSAAMQSFQDDVIRTWLEAQGGNKDNWLHVQETFLLSLAGYCVATYVLGIGDRHNDNIMIRRDGAFFHIDFGHFLGNFKKKFGYKREKAPFIFTPALARVLDGLDSPMYKRFESVCCRAYNVLRKHSNLIITLFFLMVNCGIPELRRP